MIQPKKVWRDAADAAAVLARVENVLLDILADGRVSLADPHAPLATLTVELHALIRMLEPAHVCAVDEANGR